MMSKNNLNSVSKHGYIGVFLILFLVGCPNVQARNCVKVDQCKCKFDDNGMTVDLTPIGQTGGPLVRDVFAADNYAYSYNPCYPFTEGTCINAAACQIDMTNIVYYNIGDSSNVDFSIDGNNVVVTYVSDDQARTSKVTLVCDKNTSPPTVQVQGETSNSIYEFTVTGKEVCPTGGGVDPVDPSGSVTVTVSISIGTVLTIIFFAVVVVYLIVGVLFLKFVKHNEGKSLVPNANVWMTIPGLVKDGVLFSVSLVRRKGAYRPV